MAVFKVFNFFQEVQPVPSLIKMFEQSDVHQVQASIGAFLDVAEQYDDPHIQSVKFVKQFRIKRRFVDLSIDQVCEMRNQLVEEQKKFHNDEFAYLNILILHRQQVQSFLDSNPVLSKNFKPKPKTDQKSTRGFVMRNQIATRRSGFPSATMLQRLITEETNRLISLNQYKNTTGLVLHLQALAFRTIIQTELPHALGVQSDLSDSFKRAFRVHVVQNWAAMEQKVVQYLKKEHKLFLGDETDHLAMLMFKAILLGSESTLNQEWEQGDQCVVFPEITGDVNVDQIKARLK